MDQYLSIERLANVQNQKKQQIFSRFKDIEKAISDDELKKSIEDGNEYYTEKNLKDYLEKSAGEGGETFEKAKKDLSKLQKQIVVGKNGKKYTVWKKVGQEQKKERPAAKQEEEEKKLAGQTSKDNAPKISTQDQAIKDSLKKFGFKEFSQLDRDAWGGAEADAHIFEADGVTWVFDRSYKTGKATISATLDGDFNSESAYVWEGDSMISVVEDWDDIQDQLVGYNLSTAGGRRAAIKFLKDSTGQS